MRVIYNFFILLIIVISPIIILIRIFKKKESHKRFFEKFSLFAAKKKIGKTIWFHCSSVGEFLSILPIIEKLENLKKIENILITTSTLSSANLFTKFKFRKTFHQFYPIDNEKIVKKFLDHWKPNVAFFIESEVWPEMISNIKKRNIKLILLNARISKNSFKKWNLIKKSAIKIFNKFDYIYPQNKETVEYLKKFNVKKIKLLGNLKFSESSKTIEQSSLSNLFNNRLVFCAASTHNNEEKTISELHRKIKRKLKNLITVIIPRHIERKKEIIQTLEQKKLKYICHSTNKKPEKDTDIYLVDVYGESSRFYNLSKLVFIGGSLVNRGGQNPLEPVRSGCSIIHGKNIDNFKDIFKMLASKSISKQVSLKNLDKITLNILKKKFSNKKQIKIFKNMGKKILSSNLKEINKHII